MRAVEVATLLEGAEPGESERVVLCGGGGLSLVLERGGKDQPERGQNGDQDKKKEATT